MRNARTGSSRERRRSRAKPLSLLQKDAKTQVQRPHYRPSFQQTRQSRGVGKKGDDQSGRSAEACPLGPESPRRPLSRDRGQCGRGGDGSSARSGIRQKFADGPLRFWGSPRTPSNPTRMDDVRKTNRLGRHIWVSRCSFLCSLIRRCLPDVILTLRLRLRPRLRPRIRQLPIESTDI